MLIYLLLQVVLWLVNFAFEALEFDLPTWQQVVLRITEFITYLASGCKILATYTDFEYLLILLSLSMLVATFHGLYKVLRWIIRKIPFINIS